MEFPDTKKLKKFADACRKAGIKTFKCDGMEFTLSDDAPEPSPYLKKKSAHATPVVHAGPDTPESDSLSEEDMLFWSVLDHEMDTERKAG